MQQIKKPRQKERKATLLILAAAVLLIGGVVAAYYLNQPKPAEQPTANDTSTVSPQPSDSETRESSQDKQQPDSPYVDPSKNTDEVPKEVSSSLKITKLLQTSGTVDYQAEATGARAGKCSALFTSEIGKPVTRTSDTSTGVCKASIPSTEFDSLGEWTLTVRFYFNNKQIDASKKIVLR